MNSWMQTFALIELSISCSVVFIWGLQKCFANPLPFAVKVLLVILIGNLLFWPLGLGMQLPLAAYIRGVTGDLSIVLTLLLWSSLLPSSKPTPILFKFSLTMIGLAFYPFALGLGMVDPYVWGYSSIAFLVAVLIFAVICALSRWTKGTWVIAIAIIAWAVHWHESANLWDYLLDPVLVIWSLVSIFGGIFRRRREKARAGYLFRPG